MITDVHTHIWETPDQLGRGAAKHIRRHVEQPWDRPDASISAHESAMEPVHAALVHGFESRYLGASVSAKQVATHVARQPDKYIGFAGVDPLGDYQSQISEARQLGLRGVTICPAGQSCHPSHSRAMKVYQLCVDHGMPIFVHPATHLGADAKLEFALPYLFDEIARTFPKLRIVIGQIGYPWIDQGLALIGKHEHVYAEISNVVSRPWQLYNTLLTAHQLGVTDRLLFGSDYPFCTPEKAITTIYSVNTLTQGTPLPTVPREKLRSIVERDVLTCLGLSKATDEASNENAGDEDNNKEDDSTPTEKISVLPTPSGNGHDKSSAATIKTGTPAVDEAIATDPASTESDQTMASQDSGTEPASAQDTESVAEEMKVATVQDPVAEPTSLSGNEASDSKNSSDESKDESAEDTHASEQTGQHEVDETPAITGTESTHVADAPTEDAALADESDSKSALQVATDADNSTEPGVEESQAEATPPPIPPPIPMAADEPIETKSETKMEAPAEDAASTNLNSALNEDHDDSIAETESAESNDASSKRESDA